MVQDVHNIAERYLKDIRTGDAFFYDGQMAEEILTPGMTGPERVVVVREDSPNYLAGIKPSGRPVWTHCMKLASSFNTPSPKLADVLDRMEQYQIDVDTMPACWFSNHQP